MNKTLTAVLAVLAGSVGFGVGSIAQADQPAPIIKLVNTKLVRVEQSLQDGGTSVSWLARSCGYLLPLDGGTQHVAEPCWDSRVDDKLFAPIEKALVTP